MVFVLQSVVQKGELALEAAPVYYEYGNALLQNAAQSADVFGARLYMRCADTTCLHARGSVCVFPLEAMRCRVLSCYRRGA